MRMSMAKDENAFGKRMSKGWKTSKRWEWVSDENAHAMIINKGLERVSNDNAFWYENE